MTTPTHRINPIDDPRWRVLVDEHPRASVFHTDGWLEALRRTYGYEVAALTSAAPGERLTDGIVYCHVQSWLTGRRLVSLPFSDHCEPLACTPEEYQRLVAALKMEVRSHKRTNGEIRDARCASLNGSQPEPLKYWLHRLPLERSEDELFRHTHKDCVQRKIRRAGREAIVCEEGRSDRLLDQFYQLLLMARRRQRIPAQPFVWFRNLVDCMGNKLTIRVASKDGHPIASIMTLRFKTSLVYKYGCSDRRVSNLGGMQLLLW